MLRDLIISRVRVKILELFFLNAEMMFHVREIVRRTDEEINAVRRELAHLEKTGILAKEPRANRLFYTIRKEYPLYLELLELITKTSGLGGEIIKKKAKLGRLKFVMISGTYLRGKEHAASAVDLLFVGSVVLPEISSIIKAEEAARGKEINFTVMTEEEFAFRKQRNDPFVKEILWGSRLMIIGDEDELVA